MPPTTSTSAQALLELVCACGNTQPCPVPRVRVALGEDWLPALAELVASAHAARWHVTDDLTTASCPPCLRTARCLTWQPQVGHLVVVHRFGPAVPALNTGAGCRLVRICQECGWRHYDPPPPAATATIVGAVRLTAADASPMNGAPQ
ncbi:hypothetical protein [Streptoalloteichus hindustanus]|uniref:Uncharacterized protein n=1 Tax=Streptoalloteichus hindustanus TaxID=2017 RepID=A0A1M5M8V5_STRHI|nr:hypothetical protein [Streptoalloteichus hindustanus]SHG73707.1 hypothetical protein SAMN05444320_11334 [Streptoalloteichus hindustanus]